MLNKTIESRREIYHMLMPFKIREILLVSSLYDAFIIEEEGLISELVIGQYQHHLLSSPPRVTRVSSGEEALEKAKDGRFDMVITMSKHIGMNPFEFGEKIKEIHPHLPVILLVTDSADIDFIKQEENRRWRSIDKIFYWTGDPTLFLAIIKCVEDYFNAPHDTINGNVRVIILVEDSIQFYSMFLPIIYTEIVQQTRRSLSEDLNEMQRLLKRRMRPKILLAETYEEAVELYEKYKDYILGIITDVEFKRNGEVDSEAGYKFIEYVRSKSKYVRILVESSDQRNREKAESLGASFLYKNSPTLREDFEGFLLQELGFGDFIFRLPSEGKLVEITRASNMKEFEEALKEKIPLESIKYHAERNDFSNWLMARGEFKLAMELQSKKLSDFTDLQEVREYLINVFRESRREKQMGVITDFSEQKFEFDSTFTRIRGDSLGGKGRGIAFIRSLIARYGLEKKYPGVRITVPSTVVIGTLEFDRFLTENNIREKISDGDLTDEEIAEIFLEGEICEELKDDLRRLLKYFRTPLAVRSSSILEDSPTRSFAGIYLTYMLPNNHPDDEVRLKQLCQAIKLIYASVFFKEAREYIASTSSKPEEEKMAVVIQELVGMENNNWFYPTFSGVAQSINFYPVSPQKTEDGIASTAVGLGKTVVNGEKCLRFSPRYPKHIPGLSTTSEILRETQRELYVLDLSKEDFKLSINEDVTLKKIRVEDIKYDPAIPFLASTYDINDDIIRDGGSLDDKPILITFAGILKYNLFPLAEILREILDIGEKGMGCPIQIEFAVNLREDQPSTFALLQIRPLPQYSEENITIDEPISREQALLYSTRAMGNGIVKLWDVIYVKPDGFDSTKTIEIATEIEHLNRVVETPYLLIGPGRWGTRDRFLGIPVSWGDISNAKVIVEASIENFHFEPSQGTHFLHNVISKGVGYIMTSHKPEEFIDWEWLETQPSVETLRYVKYLHLKDPLLVKLDGRRGEAVILKPLAE